MLANRLIFPAVTLAGLLTTAATIAQSVELPKDIQKDLEPSPLAKPAAGDDELRKLVKERYMAAARELELRMRRFQVGAREETLDFLLGCVKRRAFAEAALSDRPADRVQAYERIVRVAKYIEDGIQKRFDSGRVAVQDLQFAKYEHLGLKIRLLELKRQAAAAKGGR
jgi:hypothetical protein